MILIELIYDYQGNNGDFPFMETPIYPLVNIPKNYGTIHHAINGKTHYFYGHFQ